MSAERKEYTLEELESIVQHLNKLRLKYAWIGGQAVGMWAKRYLDTESAKKLGIDIPVTSKDGDIRANEEVAKLLAQNLNAPITAIRLKDPTRGKVWILAITLEGHTKPITLDVMEKVPGLNTNGVIYSLPISPSKKLRANILDPVSLLHAKADVWLREKDAIDKNTGLPKERNDEKHLIILGAIMTDYLRELACNEKKGVQLPTTLAAEKKRLDEFLDKYPTLPQGVTSNLRSACQTTDGVGGGSPGGSGPGIH